MIYAAKIVFCILLVAIGYLVLFGHINADRAFALEVLTIGCLCQMLWGRQKAEPQQRTNEILEFYPTRKLQ